MEDEFAGLNALDRDLLMSRLIDELPGIRETLKVSADAMADKTGIDKELFKLIETGKRSLKWSEFMSILFVLWNNDIGRGIVEAKGLFPEALKRAMSVNRNAHAPVTESAKYGF